MSIIGTPIHCSYKMNCSLVFVMTTLCVFNVIKYIIFHCLFLLIHSVHWLSVITGLRIQSPNLSSLFCSWLI